MKRFIAGLILFAFLSVIVAMALVSFVMILVKAAIVFGHWYSGLLILGAIITGVVILFWAIDNAD